MDFIARIIDEVRELDVRTESLESFLENVTLGNIKIDLMQHTLLSSQHRVMCDYIRILNERLDDLSKNEEMAEFIRVYKMSVPKNSNISAIGINRLVSICHEASVNAGWHDKPREVGTMLALIHSEISEALEGFQKDLMDDHLPNRKMAEVELADAVIRIFDLAGSCSFDLGGAFIEKLAHNATRDDHKRENRAKEGGKAF